MSKAHKNHLHHEMSQEVFLRSISGPMVADKFDDNKSSYKPIRNPRTTPFIRDPQYINFVSGGVLGGTTRWEIPKIGDYITRIDPVATWGALVANAGVANAAIAYCDYLMIAAIKELRISYGSQILQRIERDQLYIYGQRFLREERMYHWQRLVGGGMNQAARVLAAGLRQYLRAQLTTLWINQIESNAFMCNATSTKIAIEIDWEPSVNLLQQWGVVAGVPVVNTGLPASVAGIASPGWTDATFFDGAYTHGCQLRVEFVHVTSMERGATAALYRSGDGLRYLLTDIQKHPSEIIAGTTQIQGGMSYTFQLKNISQPVFIMVFMFRWLNDLTTTYQSAVQQNRAFGREYFNCGGWYAPAGTSLPLRPLFQDIQLKSNNYFLANEGYIVEYLHGIQGNYFENGPSSMVAMPTITYSQVPTAPACTYGCIDYGTIDQPSVFLYYGADCAAVYATINALATADIGVNSSLRVDVVAFTYNNVDISQNDASRPWN